MVFDVIVLAWIMDHDTVPFLDYFELDTLEWELSSTCTCDCSLNWDNGGTGDGGSRDNFSGGSRDVGRTVGSD